MRIGIDTRLASYGRESGIAQYTLQLLHALAQQDGDDSLVMLYHWKDEPRRLLQPWPARLRARRLFTPPHHRYEQWLLPAEIAAQNLRVLHSPDFIPPLRRNCASVITVHDLAFKLYPHLLTAESAAYYGQIERAVQSADQIIAVSEATRRDCLRLLDVDEKKITVVHEAADPIYRPMDDVQRIQAALDKHHLVQPFVLFVGTVEPRKNIPLLLHAFRHLLDRTKMPVQLAIAGRRGWLADDVYALVQELRLAEHVTFLGPVPRDELALLYNSARCFVLPSLYEGFGLPPLEAMACGTPVIVADTSALPEVVGEAGLRVSASDADELSAALERVLGDEALRAELRAKGLAQAQKFAWERAARETLAVYRRAAGT